MAVSASSVECSRVLAPHAGTPTDQQGGFAAKAWYAVNYRNTAVGNQVSGAEWSAGCGDACLDYDQADMKVFYCFPSSCVDEDGNADAFTNIGSVTRGNVGDAAGVHHGAHRSTIHQSPPTVASRRVARDQATRGSDEAPRAAPEPEAA